MSAESEKVRMVPKYDPESAEIYVPPARAKVLKGWVEAPKPPEEEEQTAFAYAVGGIGGTSVEDDDE